MTVFGNSLAVRNGHYANVLGSPSRFDSKCFGFGWPRICLSPKKAIVGIIGGGVRAILQVDVDSRRVLGFGMNPGEGLALGIDVVSKEQLREKGFLGMRKTKLVCTVSPSCWVINKSEGVDFIAMFVNDANNLKAYISTKSSKPIGVLAKIESLEALCKVGDIIAASDGIMIARGDLGVEIPLEHIPAVQKEITSTCRQRNEPVIVASQLLESMVEFPTATRVEVADVSEAVTQYADGLMLPGESAIGLYGEKSLTGGA